jgi:hypothetical protein
MTKYTDTNENWIDNLNSSRNLNLDNTSDKNSFTLRVRGGDSENSEKKSTDPVGLSRSILHVLRQNQDGWVNVQCVGAKSLYIASIAFQLAASEIEKYSRSVRLVSTQWTYAAEIGGKPAKGINIRIFAIPEIHAR